MLISLFNDDSILKKSNRRFSFVTNIPYRLCSNQDVQEVTTLVALESFYDLELMRNINHSLNSSRVPFMLMGVPQDTHFELECLNISDRSKEYLVIISVEPLIGAAIKSLTSGNLADILSIDSLKDFSKMVSRLEFTEDFLISNLLGYSKEFDDYIKRLSSEYSNPTEFMETLVTSINSNLFGFSKYLASYIESYTDLSLLSFHGPYICCSSSVEFKEPITVEYLGDKFIINPYCTIGGLSFYRDRNDFDFGGAIA